MNNNLIQPDSAAITLRRVWQDYEQDRDIKPITVRNYRQSLNNHLGDWLDLPITTITKDMIERRHREINGPAMANKTMRVLRSLLHYAHFKYENSDGSPIIKANPVRRLSETRAWHKDKHRRTLITPQQMRAWFRAVFSLPDATSRDLLLLMVLTGMRRSEAMNLKWTDVDLSAGVIKLETTKNGNAFTVPLSDYAQSVLASRSIGAVSEWVFPGRTLSQPMSSACGAIDTIERRSGVRFRLHDLRRTYCSVADELDLKSEVIRSLVNHTTDGVTEGYICRSTERLRRATQAVTDAMLRYAGISKASVAALSIKGGEIDG